MKFAVGPAKVLIFGQCGPEKNNLASIFVAMHLLLLVYHTTISISSLNRATNGILSQMIYVIVRPLSTVEYTSVASLFHCRQWSD